MTRRVVAALVLVLALVVVLWRVRLLRALIAGLAIGAALAIVR